MNKIEEFEQKKKNGVRGSIEEGEGGRGILRGKRGGGGELARRVSAQLRLGVQCVLCAASAGHMRCYLPEDS